MDPITRSESKPYRFSFTTVKEVLVPRTYNSFKKNKSQIFRAWLSEIKLLMLIHFIDLKGIQHGNKGH